MKINAIVLAAVGAVTLLPASVSARSTYAEPLNAYQVSQEVEYRDLDLTNEKGRARLDHRLASAVRKVCGPMDMRNLSQAARVNTCRRQASNFAARGRELALAAGNRRAEVAALTVNTDLIKK